MVESPMSNATKPFVLGLLFLVAYFAVGAFFVYSRTPPAPPAGSVAQLSPPFEYFYGNKLAFAVKVPDLQSFSDSVDEPRTSPFIVYENDRPLGPVHSAHVTIAELGGGRFSHWTGEGFIFSSSDNTNPQSTGRRYWIVKPK